MPPKSLQLLGVRGRQTPVVNKRLETDARNRPPENPVNCPHCGQLWLPIAPEAAPGLYPASSFVLRTPAKSGENPLESPDWDWDSTQPRKGAHSGTQRHTGVNTGHLGWGAIITLGLCCGLSNSPGAGIRLVYSPVYALCPSLAGMNWMPSFSAFALAFCCAAARSAFANCRS